eukprot:463123-Alexandrium_andersonii.AAC.1
MATFTLPEVESPSPRGPQTPNRRQLPKVESLAPPSRQPGHAEPHASGALVAPLLPPSGRHAGRSCAP